MSTPHAFVAIYTGETVSSARLLAASADADLVQYVVERLLHSSEWQPKENTAINALNEGRKQALSLVTTEEVRRHD